MSAAAAAKRRVELSASSEATVRSILQVRYGLCTQLIGLESVHTAGVPAAGRKRCASTQAMRRAMQRRPAHP